MTRYSKHSDCLLKLAAELCLATIRYSVKNFKIHQTNIKSEKSANFSTNRSVSPKKNQHLHPKNTTRRLNTFIGCWESD